MNLRESFARKQRKHILHILRNTSPDKFERIGEKKLLKALHRFNRISPAYNVLLKNMGVSAGNIRSIKDFQTKLPVLNKQNFFETFTYPELLGKNVKKVKLATSSSGFSGTFAYGFASEKALKSGKTGIDTTLDYWFDISSRKTFLINCAPMGVHIETSLPLAETSVRSDMALSLIRKISPEFDQTIIVGDPHFLKKLIEEGAQQKVNWKALGISLITGQDWLPETLRTYMARLLDIDPETDEHRGIFATMGMTELGLNVFHESKYTVRLRRTLLKDSNLRRRLISSDMKACPTIFHYYPFRTYIESTLADYRHELLFSILDKKSLIPLMRYSTGDSGEIIRHSDLLKILDEDYPQLIPDLKLPLGIMCGRLKNEFTIHHERIYLEDIKEGLYSNFEVASKITGLLSLRINAGNAELWIQLRNETQNTEELQKKIIYAVHSFLPIEINVIVFEYHKFPHALEINYERKLSAL
jgi:phenylacetate-CoA ligase